MACGSILWPLTAHQSVLFIVSSVYYGKDLVFKINVYIYKCFNSSRCVKDCLSNDVKAKHFLDHQIESQLFIVFIMIAFFIL